MMKSDELAVKAAAADGLASQNDTLVSILIALRVW
jgi:hypothetical protein